MRTENRKPVSGQLLRLLADRANAAGQKQLCIELHNLARQAEAEEGRQRCAA